MSDVEVALRPVDEVDLAIIAELVETQAGGEFAWFGFRVSSERRKRWEASALLDPDGGTLMVVRGDERLGFVNWRRKRTMTESWYWEMGIGLMPSARGKGYGTTAQRLLVDYLFAHSPVHRIEADTELENIAEQRALEKAGFTREGVVRAAVWRDGAWRDGCIYGILRTDPRPPDHG